MFAALKSWVTLGVFAAGIALGAVVNGWRLGVKVAEITNERDRCTANLTTQTNNATELSDALNEANASADKAAKENESLTRTLSVASSNAVASGERIKALTRQLAAKPLPADPTAAAREAVRRLGAIAQGPAPAPVCPPAGVSGGGGL